MKAKTFRVVYEPDEGGWHASIPDVRGCRTWGRSLSEARRNIREALSTCEDVFTNAEPIARAAVLVDDVKLPATAKRELEGCRTARSASDAAAKEAKARTAAAARALKAAGCSMRDAGELLGVSPEAVRLALAPTEATVERIVRDAAIKPVGVRVEHRAVRIVKATSTARLSKASRSR